MMNKNLFSEGLGHIDVDAVERLLQIEQKLEKRQARRKRAWIRPVLIAAALALLLCTVLVIVPFIPKDLGIEYQTAPEGTADIAYVQDHAWIYYTKPNGQTGQKNVKLPLAEENVFLAWKHLCGVGDDVELITYTVTTDEVAGAQPVPGLWDALMQQISPMTEQKTVTVTLSEQIASYPNYRELIESLKKTLAKYAGIDPDQIIIKLDEILNSDPPAVDPPVVDPPVTDPTDPPVTDPPVTDSPVVDPPYGADGPLLFRHNYQPQTITVTVGSQLEISVEMINISIEDIEFTGSWGEFVPEAILSMNDSAIIKHEEYMVTQEYMRYVLAPGESREIAYTFPIPEDAVCGEYALTLSFGEYSFTFEKAVHVIGFGYVPPDVELDAFTEIIHHYGFDQTDPMLFKTSIGKLTYQGNGLFDIMTEGEAEWAEGYSGELYHSDLFSCSLTTYSEDYFAISQYNRFEARALPDGMLLPCWIEEQDSLLEALGKIGLDEYAAKTLIETAYVSEGVNITETGPESNAVLSLLYDGMYYKIVYNFTEFKDQSSPDYGHHVTFSLYYSAKEQGFVMLLAEASDTHVNQLSIQNVFLRQEPGSQYTVSLTAYHQNSLLRIMNGSSWEQGYIETTPILIFDADGLALCYSSGYLYTDFGYYLRIDGYDRYLLDALSDAVVSLKTGTYDCVIYYADEYYGHSASVDEALAKMPGYSDHAATGIIGGGYDDAWLFGYQSEETDDLPDGTSFEDHPNYLVTEDGRCFEQFTKFEPSLKGTEITVTQYRGQDTNVALTTAEAGALSEILQTYEWESSLLIEDYIYDMTFEINGYQVCFSPQFGTLRIGNYWGAELSDKDCAMFNQILMAYFAEE